MQGPKKPAEAPPLTPGQAVNLALADARALPPEERCYYRYLFCPDGQFKPAALSLNMVSRNSVLVRPLPLAEGRILRADLRAYVADEHDLEDWLDVWEDFQYDPWFALLITRAAVDFAATIDPNVKKQFPTKKKRKVVDCPVYRGADGYLYNWKYVYEDVPDDFDVLRLVPAYLPQLAELEKLLHTRAPITSDAYFAARALTTVQNKGAYAQVWGGRYYDLRGIERSKKQGVTDEDLFLQHFGVKSAKELYATLTGDQRAALFRSGVTDKPRRVDFFNVRSGRAWDFMGIGSITHDLRDRDIDVDVHPVMNLIDFKDQAREEIFVGPNGLHVYAIFDGKGKLLDEAALDVVTDRTVPGNAAPKLQPALSCIACHEAEGSGGWRGMTNDVKLLLGDRRDTFGRPRPDLDIFLDLREKDRVKAVNLLASLYAGDFSTGMRRGRDDYAKAVLQAAGPQGDDLADVARTATRALVERTRGYVYNLVDAGQALRELGIARRKDRKATEQLSEVLGIEPGAVGFAPEDPRLAALRKGLAISRFDWAFVYSFAAARAAKKNK